MSDDPCAAFRQDLEAALQEWRRAQPGSANQPEAPGSPRLTPRLAGQLGSRFQETVGRAEAAQRRYRSAVRALAECLRTSA